MTDQDLPSKEVNVAGKVYRFGFAKGTWAKVVAWFRRIFSGPATPPADPLLPADAAFFSSLRWLPWGANQNPPDPKAIPKAKLLRVEWARRPKGAQGDPGWVAGALALYFSGNPWQRKVWQPDRECLWVYFAAEFVPGSGIYTGGLLDYGGTPGGKATAEAGIWTTLTEGIQGGLKGDPKGFPRTFPAGTRVAVWFGMADHPDDRSNVVHFTWETP